MLLKDLLSPEDYSTFKGQLLRTINDNRGWYLMKWKGYCQAENDFLLEECYWDIVGRISGQYELLTDLSIINWDTYSELVIQLKENMKNIALRNGKEID